MKNTLPAILLLGVAAAAPAPAQPGPSPAASSPTVEHYGLRFGFDLEHHALTAQADLRIRNSSERAVTIVPVLLYRLFEVEAASDDRGVPLAFAQKVVKFADEPTWQTNSVQVTLATPLEPGRATTIRLRYGGPLLGYPEVMRYVRDTIGEDYSLIRPETMAYPLAGPPTDGGWRQALRGAAFGYDLEAVVPAGFVVACNGSQLGQPTSEGGNLTYRCSGAPGSSQVGLAVAKFQVLGDPERNLRVYALAADAEAGQGVMTEMRRALDFYRSYLGPMAGGGLTLIEIPEGWGSYTLRGTIFQAAAAFRDAQRIPELYHEVSHLWNARPADRVRRTRYFDEAFASYFEALAVRQFQGDAAFRAHLERYRESFIRGVTRDPRGRTTAIADYGNEELGDFSYSKGAWTLYVLHQLLGEDAFRRSIAAFLVAYADKPADFDAFRSSVESSSGRDLRPWFEQWILAGPDSSALLTEGKTVEEMAARCQPSPRPH